MSEPLTPDRDPSLPDEWLAALLAGDGPLTVGDADNARAAADLAAFLVVARAPARSAELVGETALVAAFAHARDTAPAVPASTSPWSVRSIAAALRARRSKVAAVVAAGGLSIAGFGAAAFANALPDAAQNFAHHTLGAPAARPHAPVHPHPSPTPVGPDATGAAAHGLCTAYAAEQAHGGGGQESVAFRNLATAAGGASKITAYCATSPTSAPTAADHPGEQATDHSSGRPDDQHSTGSGEHPSAGTGDHGSPGPDDHSTARPGDHHSAEPSPHPSDDSRPSAEGTGSPSGN